MNKHLHRIIFNASRGQRMVVQETAASTGKANGTTKGVGTSAGGYLAGAATTRLTALAFAALVTLGVQLQFIPSAHAQIVVDTSAPRSQQAILLNTASGLPQVNITTPGAGGVSRNTFTQFDIQSQGAILNNSRTNVQTQLGGFIQGNAALAGGSARVILNEVNSASPTQLRGFVEVAGQRAEVIIANPSGINVDGGGFINATRATLTTGTPVINSGNLDGFLVQKGVITVNGAGLDSTQTDFTGLMARAIQVNAGIWAQDLKLTAGANQVSADQSLVTAAPATASGPVPAFGIDTALLGGMYAGKITLVGTEAGLGVRNAGTIAATAASAGNIAISANGMLTNAAGARISGTGDAILSAASLANDGQVIAGAQANITTTGTFANNSLVRGAQVQLQADRLNNTGTGQIEGTTVNGSASNISNAGQVLATGQLGLTATGTLTNQGKLAGQQTTVQAATLNNQGTGRIEGDTLDITAGTVNNTAGMAGNNVTVTAGTLNNQGTGALIAGTSQVNLYVTNTLNNTGGATAYSLGDLNIAASAVRDAGGTLLNRTALVNNDSSLLQGDNDVQIAAQTFNNVRPAPVITNSSTSSTKVLTKASGYAMCEYNNYIDNFAGYCADHYANLSWYNPDIHINPYAEKPGMFIGGWMVEAERYTTTTVTSDALAGALAPEPKVLAGRNLILRNVGNLRNEYGSLAAGRDVTIGNTDPLGAYQTASVTNIGGLLNQNTLVDEYSVFRWNRNYGSATSQSLAPVSNTVVTGRIGGSMTAGRTFTVNAGTVTNTNALPGQSNVTGAASPGPDGTAFSLPSLGALLIPPLTNPTRGYLIESDPRFANYRNWLSSDYMLTALGTDPALMQKRLGDGFYEQRLIREQVNQLTGRRFLDGYASDEAQYQALMVSGVTVARQWMLRPGVALTAAQVSQLTSDIVWLVEQTVAVSDGKGGTTQTRAWVPVVYLSQIHTADLHPTGALISGQSVSIAARGDLTNNGALQARDSILLAAGKVTNEIGLIDASRGTTTVRSDTDIINRSGLISGNSVQLDAARDIQLDAVTRQITATRQTASGQVSGSNTELGPQGSVVSRGDLAINAGRDIRLAGALVSAQGNASLNAGASLVVDTVQTQQSTQDVSGMGVRRSQSSTNLASSLQTGGSLSLTSGGDTTLRAAQIGAGQDVSIVSGGNLTILNATNTTQLDEAMRAKGYVRNDHTVQERVVGSSIVAGGNVTLAALQTAPDGNTSPKGNITVQGSSVNAVTGQLNVVAANSVNIIEAREKGEYELFNETKGSKTFSSKTQTAHDTGSSDIAVGSSLSGKTVNIDAGKDLTVRGSSVVSDNKTTLLATNNITIEAAQNFETSTTFREEKKSGLMSSGGIGFTVGSKQQSTGQQDTRTSASASTVGSIAGNVTATAGNNYRQVGSDVLTPAGNVTISAQKVDIVEARETSQSATEQKFKQSGLTVALTAPIISALQTAEKMGEAATQTKDGRMQLLASATTALAAKNAYDAVKADPKAAGGINIAITVGGSKSQTNTDFSSNSARGSTVAASGNVDITASGAGKGSNILIQGSTVQAGKATTLLAENQIQLLAALNESQSNRNSSGSSAGVGVAISVGSNGVGFGITANASASKGEGQGRDTTWTNTLVEGGQQVNLISGADTTLKGAVVKAPTVKADVGGNLNIESLQDTSTFNSKDQSIGGSVTVGVGFSGSLNFSDQKINSDFQSVTEQSGIKAGDGGFQVSVAGNTDLKGSVIASTDKAVADGKNIFITGTLTQSDIQNKAEYNADSVAFGGGFSDGKGLMPLGGGSGAGSAGGVGTDADGKAQTGAAQTPGSTLPGYNGFSATPPIALSASGNASSTTGSGISSGTMAITDDQKQQALTGKTAEQTVATLDSSVRSDRDGSNALKPIFNEQEIKAGFEIVGAFTREAGTFLTTQAAQAEKEKKEVAEKILASNDPVEIERLKTQSIELNKWGMGGFYQQISTAFIGALSGQVTGQSSQIIQAAGINYLQSLAAQQIKDIADGLESETARASLHAIAACAGASAQGASCASAAAGASLSSLINFLLSDASNATAEQKAARVNFLATLTAGIAASLGGDAAAATTAARIETENNALYRNAAIVSRIITPQIKKLEEDLIEKKISLQEYATARTEIAVAAAKIDALTTIYNTSDKLGLASQIAQMQPQHIAMLGEAIGGILMVPGMASSAYELLVGKSVSGEEANYFFAALGVVPGVAIGKGVGKVGELAQVLKHLPDLRAAEQIAANQAKGMSFEKAVIEYLGSPAAKNGQRFTVISENGKKITVIPDVLPGGEKILEIKNVAYLTNSPQLRAYVQLVENGAVTKAGTALKDIELVVNPNTVISVPLQRLLRDAQASVSIFDPITKTMKSFHWTI